MNHILIVTLKEEAVEQLTKTLNDLYVIETVEMISDMIKDLTNNDYEFLFIDVVILDEWRKKLKYDDTRKFINKEIRTLTTAPVILISSYKKTSLSIGYTKSKELDYLSFPIISSEVKSVLKNAKLKIRLNSELNYLREELHEDDSVELLKSKSINVSNIFNLLNLVAKTTASVLLSGETGTGKSMVARIIHQKSNRKNMPFVSIHCAAIPESLIESELFGHEKGSFTGAISRKIGKLEIANGGTLFLDEIGTINRQVQIKLLQVLQEKKIYRIGSTNEINIDCRIITATNENLAMEVQKGNFRKDLFYRLNAFPVEIPPLRERCEDIDDIVKKILEKENEKLERDIKGVSGEVLQAFKNYAWPGNIREIENVIERACIIEQTDILTGSSFPIEIMALLGEKNFETDSENFSNIDTMRKKALGLAEEKYLIQLMTSTNGKLKDTAKIAGISTRHLNNLIRKYSINKKSFKQ